MSNNSTAPVVKSPTEIVADTPVISLGPNSNPRVPKLDVAAIPLIGSVLTPKAIPGVPKVIVDDCPSRLTVGLITKLNLYPNQLKFQRRTLLVLQTQLIHLLVAHLFHQKLLDYQHLKLKSD